MGHKTSPGRLNPGGSDLEVIAIFLHEFRFVIASSVVHRSHAFTPVSDHHCQASQNSLVSVIAIFDTQIPLSALIKW